jgi:hypothetical protein
MNFIVQNEIIVLIGQVPPSPQTGILIDKLNNFRNIVTEHEDKIRDLLTKINEDVQNELFSIQELNGSIYKELEEVLIKNRQSLYDFYAEVHEFTSVATDTEEVQVIEEEELPSPRIHYWIKQTENRSIEDILIDIIDKAEDTRGLTILEVHKQYEEELPPQHGNVYVLASEIRDILNRLVKEGVLVRTGTGRGIRYASKK